MTSFRPAVEGAPPGSGEPDASAAELKLCQHEGATVIWRYRRVEKLIGQWPTKRGATVIEVVHIQCEACK